VKISKEIKVALLGITSLVILYFGFNYLKGVDMFQKTNSYYALYNKVDMLKVSNPVYIHGVSVGRVSSIKYLQQRNNSVLVEIGIDSEIKLGVGTVADLINADIMGSKAIELVLKDSTGQYYIDGDTLMTSFDEGLTGMLKEKAGSLTDNISVAISNLTKILETIAAKDDTLAQTLVNMEGITRNLNDSLPIIQSRLIVLLENFNKNSQELSQLMADVKPILKNTTQLTDSLKALELSETLAKLQIMLDNMNANMVSLKEGQGTMGKLMTDDSLYVYLSNTARDLDLLLVDFQENPGRYVQFSVFGKKDKTEKESKKAD
jgi:phospholipid/cholesterol/gamma-HCH transport system substrate-binding protein